MLRKTCPRMLIYHNFFLTNNHWSQVQWYTLVIQDSGGWGRRNRSLRPSGFHSETRLRDRKNKKRWFWDVAQWQSPCQPYVRIWVKYQAFIKKIPQEYLFCLNLSLHFHEPIHYSCIFGNSHWSTCFHSSEGLAFQITCWSVLQESL